MHCPRITEADYIELVDATGRMMVPGKRGAISAREPTVLDQAGIKSESLERESQRHRQRLLARYCRLGGFDGYVDTAALSSAEVGYTICLMRPKPLW
jgi:hypothetical protein